MNFAEIDDAASMGIVYFGNDWYAENRTSSHHVARGLAARLPVLYVDSPGLRRPAANRSDAGRLWRKLRQTFRRTLSVEPGVWHCTVPQLPWRRVPGVGAINRWFGTWAVRRGMRDAGIRRPILWFVVPHPAFMLDALPSELAVYYCIDDYAAHPGVDAPLIASCDALLTERADLVFVASPTLIAAKLALNAGTRFAPHGVDVALFARAQHSATQVPAAAAALRGPIVGYFGLLAAWTDLELIGWLADQRPHWQLLLIGHAKVDISELVKRSNITWVGAQPYETLPAWAKAFDVAIIPYRLNQQVRNANPLKLREYLATGKPVVSVPTPEIERFRSVVRIAQDRDAFLAAIEDALATDCAEDRARRMASVSDMSWEHRVSETLRFVFEALRARAVTGEPTERLGDDRAVGAPPA